MKCWRFLKVAPPFRPRMPRTGKPFSVSMSNCGALGWVSDERGYRYQATHPETGRRVAGDPVASFSPPSPSSPRTRLRLRRA